MPTIGQHMVRGLVTVRSSDPLTLCAERLLHHQIRHLPVVDHGRLVGLISDFDVLNRGWRLADTWVPFEQERWVLARDIAQPTQVCVDEAAPLEHALGQLLRAFQDAAIVVGPDGDALGILTEHDVVGGAARILPPSVAAELPEHLALQSVYRSSPAAIARDRMGPNRIRHVLVLEADDSVFGVLSFRDLAARRDLDSVRAEELVHRPLVTTAPDASLAEAARIMAEQRIGCLPVLHDDGRARGVVTRTDVTRAVIGALERVEA